MKKLILIITIFILSSNSVHTQTLDVDDDLAETIWINGEIIIAPKWVTNDAAVSFIKYKKKLYYCFTSIPSNKNKNQFMIGCKYKK